LLIYKTIIHMSNQDLFLGYIRAYNTYDLTGLLGFFAEGCVFENISSGKVTVRANGKTELEALARQSAEVFAERQQKVITWTESQDRIAAEIDYHAILRKDLSPELKAGSHLELRGVSICEFRGGKIVRLSDYS
jgi:ketosteroid isomerase-like protein